MFLERLAVREQLQQWVALAPGDAYEPHGLTTRAPQNAQDRLIYDRRGKPSGQLQFHQATHAIRVCAPGNGWGGTTAMAAEVDAWCRHTNRWQKTPSEPVQCIWFCPIYKQFDMLLPNLIDVAFGRVPRLKSGHGGHHLVWPDDSKLHLASYDTSWGHLQGIEPHLIAFDEQPPKPLWREMMQRRRGKRRARFICKATQTKGWGWMATDLYIKWKKHHEEQGITEEERMMELQLHPTIWCWPRGGIHDNSHMSAEDDAWYEQQSWASEKERKVRLYGGFEQWSGDCIFEDAVIDWLKNRLEEHRKAAGTMEPWKSGSFAPVMAADPEEVQVGDPEPGWWNQLERGGTAPR